MTGSARILLVDHDETVPRSLGPLLRSRGYEALVANTGMAALKSFADHNPNLIVLALGLPDIQGLEVLRRIRAGSQVPILVTSDRNGDVHGIGALDSGADDYILKPFGMEELLARIPVALRRVPSDEEFVRGKVRLGDLTIDHDRKRILRGCHEVRLTPKEFNLFTFMARSPDCVLTHRAILKAVWGPHAVNQPEHLWVLMGKLRKRLEPDSANPRYLMSEPWVGYRLQTHPSVA